MRHKSEKKISSNKITTFDKSLWRKIFGRRSTRGLVTIETELVINYRANRNPEQMWLWMTECSLIAWQPVHAVRCLSADTYAIGSSEKLEGWGGGCSLMAQHMEFLTNSKQHPSSWQLLSGFSLSRTVPTHDCSPHSPLPHCLAFPLVTLLRALAHLSVFTVQLIWWSFVHILIDPAVWRDALSCW